MVKKITAVCLLILGIFVVLAAEKGNEKQYQVIFYDLFDTVTTITGYAHTEAEFEAAAESVHDQLEKYHKMFDIYHDYKENNLKTINDQAGKSPVKVNSEIIELLKACRKYYDVTGGKVNAAMGSVLQLWQEAREKAAADPLNAALPDAAALREAAAHCNIDDILIFEDTSEVYIKDPAMRLDVGAVAKGWAVECVSCKAPEGMLISVGGNVRATGSKPKGESWIIGIQSPWGDNSEYIQTVDIQEESVVTSGDYQRYYMVDGTKYHHIIDPDTLYPGNKWKAVSIICKDSGLADVLSTALFLLSREEGEKLLEQYDACAVWMASENEIYYSRGYEAGR